MHQNAVRVIKCLLDGGESEIIECNLNLGEIFLTFINSKMAAHLKGVGVGEYQHEC